MFLLDTELHDSNGVLFRGFNPKDHFFQADLFLSEQFHFIYTQKKGHVRPKLSMPFLFVNPPLISGDHSQTSVPPNKGNHHPTGPPQKKNTSFVTDPRKLAIKSHSRKDHRKQCKALHDYFHNGHSHTSWASLLVNEGIA